MTTRYSNSTGISLALGVFLATDNYDYNDDPNTISATTLLKPLRQIILSSRIPPESAAVDIASMVNNRMGSAIHDGIERAWLTNHGPALASLGIPQGVIKHIVINPQQDDLFDGCIPIYLEQRYTRKLGKWTISGKVDFIGDGQLEDFKTTSVFTVMNQTNDEKYSQQGSIYRWIAPHIITKDHIAIQWLFTDWSKVKAIGDPKYPQARTMRKLFPLMSLQATEAWITRKVDQIERHWDSDEEDLPLCTDEDLWRSEPVFKYYKDPTKTKRSTKNFEDRQDAMVRFVEDGSVGLVKEVPGQVTACKYCPAFSACTQKDDLIASGDLVLNS